MASTKDYLDFVLEQLRELDEITYRTMLGEYILYYKGKVSGGTIAKEPQNVFWGGYHAYFADLDGYYWEVTWVPTFSMMIMDC